MNDKMDMSTHLRRASHSALCFLEELGFFLWICLGPHLAEIIDSRKTLCEAVQSVDERYDFRALQEVRIVLRTGGEGEKRGEFT